MMVELNEYSSDLQWCLHYMMRYWQHEVAIESPQSIEDLTQVMMKAGYQLETKDWQLEDVSHMSCPFLLKTKTNGCVVVLKMDKKRIWVEYPHLGKASYPIDQFHHYFDNQMYVIYPLFSYDFQKNIGMQIGKFAFKRWFQSPIIGGVILFFMVLYEMLSLIEPLCLNVLVQHASIVNHMKDVAIVGMFLAWILAFGLLIGYFRHRIWVYFFGRCAKDAANQLALRYVSSSMETLSSQDTHDVYTRTCSIEQICYRLLQQFFYIFLESFCALVHIAALVYCHALLAAVDIVFLILIGGIHQLMMHYYFLQSQEMQIKQQQALAVLMENITSRVQIKGFRSEIKFLKRWFQSFDVYWKQFLKIENIQLQLEWWMVLIKKINWLMSLILAIILMNKHQLSMGIFVAFLSLKAIAFSKIESLVKRLQQWQYLKAPLQRIQEIFKRESVDVVKKIDFQEKNHQISLKNFNIRNQILKDLTFEFGKKYIISGESGCGKTTLLKQLMLACEAHHELVMVQQDEIFWNTHLLNNITVFEPCFDELFMAQVLDMVGMSEWISKLYQPDIQLSGGQKQRVYLARALYRQPRWLILDESTCHLDECSEHDILQKICKLPISVIMVNHRQETHRYFDEVLHWKDLLL